MENSFNSGKPKSKDMVILSEDFKYPNKKMKVYDYKERTIVMFEDGSIVRWFSVGELEQAIEWNEKMRKENGYLK